MANIDDYRGFLDQVRKASGIEAFAPDDTGLVSVRVDDKYNVNLQYVEATGRVLCFVEVKTRHVGSMTQPYEAVTLQKQQRLIRAAQIYLAESKTDRPCRFDVCEVIVHPDTLKPANVNYIENAFEA